MEPTIYLWVKRKGEYFGTVILNYNDYKTYNINNLRLYIKPNHYVCYRDKDTGKYEYLHRLITQAPAAMYVDHANGNKLDNRAVNLRLATPMQNNWNKRTWHGHQYKGVRPSHDKKKWVARIKEPGRRNPTWLGTFPDAESAAHAYDARARDVFGDFAYVNFPKPIDV